MSSLPTSRGLWEINQQSEAAAMPSVACGEFMAVNLPPTGFVTSGTLDVQPCPGGGHGADGTAYFPGSAGAGVLAVLLVQGPRCGGPS